MAIKFKFCLSSRHTHTPVQELETHEQVLVLVDVLYVHVPPFNQVVEKKPATRQSGVWQYVPVV